MQRMRDNTRLKNFTYYFDDFYCHLRNETKEMATGSFTLSSIADEEVFKSL